MDIAIVGLGKMGANMARRLIKGGHRVVGTDRSPEAAQKLAAEAGLVPANSLHEMVLALPTPRAVWVMVPAGVPTEAVVKELGDLLSPGDTIIDGGNTYYKDDIRRASMLQPKGIHYVDVGTSGGVWGLTEGYSLMVGGETEIVSRLTPIFETLAPATDQGWGHVGAIGAGHFVKMIHNGIEYGLMQSYAEGFEIMKAKNEFDLSLSQIAEIWRYGSVVRSWLLDLLASALGENEDLKGIKAWVPDSGEGRWTVFEAVDLDVSAPVITLSLQRRLRSREDEPFADKLLAAMRNKFGGHAIIKAE